MPNQFIRPKRPSHGGGSSGVISLFLRKLQRGFQLISGDESVFATLATTVRRVERVFGLSAVHVNRFLHDWRGNGLLSLCDRRVTLHDLPSLRSVSMFDLVWLNH